MYLKYIPIQFIIRHKSCNQMFQFHELNVKTTNLIYNIPINTPSVV